MSHFGIMMQPPDIVVAKFQRYFGHEDEVLRPGARGVACRNIRHALSVLDERIPLSDGEEFDSILQNAVRQFQVWNKHRATDGLVGPGTRRLLTALLIARFGPEIFLRFLDPRENGVPTAFVSYAWSDKQIVEKICAWLHDHGIEILRDEHWFLRGTQIPENISRAIVEADKVIAVYSASSRDRDWPRVELSVAEQFEQRVGCSVLLYLKLDDTALPQHDPNRIAICAKGRAFGDVCDDLRRAILGEKGQSVGCKYDEKEVL